MSSESIISVSLKNGTKGIVKNVLYEEVRVRGRKAFRYYVSGNVKGTRTPFRMKVTSDEALALAEELDHRIISSLESHSKFNNSIIPIVTYDSKVRLRIVIVKVR